MTTQVSALAAARHMCARSDWSLTNLQLQKMLYLAQMIYLGKTGEPLFNGTFEAWDYGPVLPVVYNQVKSFGSGPIRDVFFGARAITDESRCEMLNEACDQLSQKTAGQLVNITHWSKGAWAQHYVPGTRGVIIPNAAILQEARDRGVTDDAV
jgi:uncharacterized phage-associated protein